MFDDGKKVKSAKTIINYHVLSRKSYVDIEIAQLKLQRALLLVVYKYYISNAICWNEYEFVATVIAKQ